MKNLKENLKIDNDKLDKLIELKRNYLDGKTDYTTTKALIDAQIRNLTPEEFAYSEQVLKDEGYSDDLVKDRMDNLLGLVENIMQNDYIDDLSKNHPISLYRRENKEIEKIINKIKELKKEKFIKNKWMEIYEDLDKFKIHLSRKQNQLFPALESKGFDRPSKIMWSFDNEVRDVISKAKKLLDEDREEEFLNTQDEVIEKTLDIIDKENTILYPTSLKLLSSEEFENMRDGDREIGFCLIDVDESDYENSKENREEKVGFEKELADLISKYSSIDNNQELDVKQGKLTLEQINLIFKNMPFDLSYVDENEIVKFYTDTKERVFPRSRGVIGRDVKNCHPRESVDTVMEIIEEFRENRQNEAEFWLEINGKFIYILYKAIRDDSGKFRGVLEMMADVTHIRSLEGSQRLLSWSSKPEKESSEDEKYDNEYNISSETVIGDLINKYPYIKDYMLNLSDKYKNLKNPIMYKTMSKIATLDMVAKRGGFKTEELIEKIVNRIKEEER